MSRAEPASDEEDGGHQECALDGDSEAGERGVGGGEGDGGECGDAVREACAAEEPEEHAGEQSDVHAGDDEEVEGAGALEAEAKVVNGGRSGRRRAWR